MKKQKLKKQSQSKLFTIEDFYKDDDGRSQFILSLGPDVYNHALEVYGYNLDKPKQLESYLRKSFRSLHNYKV